MGTRKKVAEPEEIAGFHIERAGGGWRIDPRLNYDGGVIWFMPEDEHGTIYVFPNNETLRAWQDSP